MDMSYQQPQQPFSTYENSQWVSDFKPTFAERDPDQQNHHEVMSSAAATPAEFVSAPPSRRPSTMKVEDDFPSHDVMWQDRHHEQHHFPNRHYSQPSLSAHGPHPPYMRVDPNFSASYVNHQWSISQSGTSTPTQAFHNIDSQNQPVQYTTNYGFNFNTDPVSAVSMSPESSQGGWASATSSDGMEHRIPLHSPPFRPVSPQLVVRPDGIRKKNARFEIPKERNLATIDALINASTDENERKELKQQKRLLRNRQAALDSRQRKKTHTEKLEAEKRVNDNKMRDLEDLASQLESQLQMQDQAWRRQREQYEMQIRQLMHDQDEIIRTKTLEAAECRRQVNFLREYIRDNHIDRPSHQADEYGQGSEMNNFTSNFGEFNVDDDFESELSIFQNPEFNHVEPENNQREVTPKPLVPVNKKTQADFSWNTFYMCLLFGAVVVSAGGSISKLANAPTDMSLPKVSDEYRADAENLLKAVMTSSPQSAQEMIPARSAFAPVATVGTDASSHHNAMPVVAKQDQSSLDSLTNSLTGPTRDQQLQQMFTMTPSTYNHITNPLNDVLDEDADADLPDSPKPTRLEQYMARLHTKKDEIERAAYESRFNQQSVLADHVPESAMADFRAFVREANAHQDDNSHA